MLLGLKSCFVNQGTIQGYWHFEVKLKIWYSIIDAFICCSTAIGIRGKDGVVFAVEKLVVSKLYEKGANKRIHSLDTHIGMVWYIQTSFNNLNNRVSKNVNKFFTSDSRHTHMYVLINLSIPNSRNRLK